MVDQKLIDGLRGQIPTATTSAIISVLTVLALGGKSLPSVPTSPAIPPQVQDSNVPAAKPRNGSPLDGIVTRLVSCGSSLEATLAGDDTVGMVAPGSGATSCTLIFSDPWPRIPTCNISGGTVTAATVTEVTILGGVPFSYRCGA